MKPREGSSSFLHSEEKEEQRMLQAMTSGWISEDGEPTIVSPAQSLGGKTVAKESSTELLGAGSLSASQARRRDPTHEEKDDDPQWKEAMDMIHANPSLLTPRVFWTTLEQDPPAHVIRGMLSISPKVASIPKEGPTALQVAVQEGACLGVIEAVLEACPFALCVTNPHHAMDPLSYVKRHRKEERELIELLSRPLSYWVSKNDSDLDHNGASDILDYGGMDKKQQPSSAPDKESPIPSFFPVSSQAATRNKTSSHRIDRQELNNVKLLCAQVLKGHKKLSKQLKVCQEQLEEDKNKKRDTSVDRKELLQELNEQQQFHFRRQLIALDMKERAFSARLRKTEERCKQHCTDQLSSWKQSLDVWKADTDEQWKEWKVLLDHEVQVNAHFRADFSQWMEDQQRSSFPSCEPASSFESGKENEEYADDDVDDDETTPILFATNLGEVSEQAPLCNSGSSSSDDVLPGYGGNQDDDDDDDDELLRVEKVPVPPRRPFLIRRRHPWTPLARKWDRICL